MTSCTVVVPVNDIRVSDRLTQSTATNTCHTMIFLILLVVYYKR
jgi:hypothetical protein